MADNETIFITGGLGFVGSHLARRFLDHGDRAVIYDILKTYFSPLEDNFFHVYLRERHKAIGARAEIIQGDIRDYGRLHESLIRIKPDKVVHLAGLTVADLSDKHPYEAMEANFAGTMNVLNAARAVPSIKKLVNISSSMVYGDFHYVPCDEAHPTNPKGIYGASKLCAEIMVRTYTQRFGVPHIIIRPSAVYGPTDSNRRVTQIFLENAFTRKPIVLHDGGAGALDFTYVEDTAQGIFLATKNDTAMNETFNITRGEGRSLKEFADILKTHFPDLEITSASVPEEERKPRRGAMDISKARARLGYNPSYPLEKGIEEYIRFLRPFYA